MGITIMQALRTLRPHPGPPPHGEGMSKMKSPERCSGPVGSIRKMREGLFLWFGRLEIHLCDDSFGKGFLVERVDVVPFA